MKNVIAFLFILVLSVQLLPIRAMGKCLYDNTFTEEQCVKKFVDEAPATVASLQIPFLDSKCDRSFHFSLSIALVAEPAFAVICPPPNFVA